MGEHHESHGPLTLDIDEKVVFDGAHDAYVVVERHFAAAARD